MANDQRLERLLATYEHAVQTLRAAIALLNNGAPVTFPLPSFGNGNGNGARQVRIVGPASVIRKQAARLDKLRADRLRADAETLAPKPTRKPKKKKFTYRLQKQRTISANFLDQFDRHDPKRTSDVNGPKRGIGSLVRRGYLAKQDGGYVRTDKHFSINPNG